MREKGAEEKRKGERKWKEQKRKGDPDHLYRRKWKGEMGGRIKERGEKEKDGG